MSKGGTIPFKPCNLDTLDQPFLSLTGLGVGGGQSFD